MTLNGNLNINVSRIGRQLIYNGYPFQTLEDNYKPKDIKNAIKKYVEEQNLSEIISIYDNENNILYYQRYSSDSNGITFYLYSDHDRFIITCHPLPSSHYTCHCISNYFNDVTEYLLDNFPSQYGQVLFTEDAEPEGIDFYFLYGCIHDETIFNMEKSKYFCNL